MNVKILTPAQIFINGKFFCIVDEVEVIQNSPKFIKSVLPDNPKLNPNEIVGTVINIKRNKRTKEEIEEVAKEKKDGEYDGFYHRMVDAVDDPEAHTPIETSDI